MIEFMPKLVELMPKLVEPMPKLVEPMLKLEQANPCLIDECKFATTPSQLAVDCFVATDLVHSRQTCSCTVQYQDLLQYTFLQETEAIDLLFEIDAIFT